jgi:undecaprenyl-diphosphatase
MDKKITLAFYRFAYSRCYGLCCFVSLWSAPFFAAVFFVCALWVFWRGDVYQGVLFLSVPAVNFALSSIIRRITRRRRPFEVCGLVRPPGGARGGSSFPSNHAAGAFIISFAVLTVNEPLGVALFFMAAAVALARVCLGAHYISDALFAFAQSAAVAVIGFNGVSGLLPVA